MTKRWRNEPDNYDDPMDIVYEYIGRVVITVPPICEIRANRWDTFARGKRSGDEQEEKREEHF